jgi:hypothetical protein
MNDNQKHSICELSKCYVNVNLFNTLMEYGILFMYRVGILNFLKIITLLIETTFKNEIKIQHQTLKFQQKCVSNFNN